MKRALSLLALLTCGCASAEMRASENDPANPSATVAMLDVGAGVLSSSFSPDRIAPDPQADRQIDPHAGHQHGAAVESGTADPHAGHSMPAPSAAAGAPKSASAAPMKPGPIAATTYTCMHHPEIVSSVKGQCPKCGMDLVPKKPAAAGQGTNQ